MNYIHHGMEIACVALLRVQLEGVRVVIIAHTEIQAILGSAEKSFNLRLRQLFDSLGVPSPSSLPSLVSAVIKVEDIVFQPAGYVLVNKACAENNVFVMPG